MKPILSPELEAEKQAVKSSGNKNSLVVPDKDVKAKAKPKILGVLPIAKPQPVKIPPVELKVDTVQVPAAAPVPAEPPVTKIPEGHGVHHTAQQTETDDSAFARSAGGLPLPPHKPIPETVAQAVTAPITPPTRVQDVAVTPAETGQPRAPIVEPEAHEDTAAAAITPPTPMTQEEIASAPPSVRRNRFSNQDRMAGSKGSAGLDMNYGSDARGNGLPDELRNVHAGKLQEDDSVSPIIIPGQGGDVPHAPEMADAADKNQPPEVVVFFQENSPELESGQMEVLQSDVVQLLKQRPDLNVEIDGYAELLAGDTGSAKKLSQARAVMIRDYLARQGIDKGRIQVTAKANETKVDPRDRADLFFSR